MTPGYRPFSPSHTCLRRSSPLDTSRLITDTDRSIAVDEGEQRPGFPAQRPENRIIEQQRAMETIVQLDAAERRRRCEQRREQYRDETQPRVGQPAPPSGETHRSTLPRREMGRSSFVAS